MITYRSLNSTDFDATHQCFLAAFADYSVDMKMARTQFEHRMIRDGVILEMSAGAFNDGAMIGFCINGLGLWQGKRTAYDAGTGVVPDYRGRGVGKELFSFIFPRLKEAGVSQYLLEVISSNVAAATLYRKLGFNDSRMLAVFRTDSPIQSMDKVPVVAVSEVTTPDWVLYQSFWDGYPSWQNSVAAVDRIVNGRLLVGGFEGVECVGYGVASRETGNLMQLAVSPNHRRRGVGSMILAFLRSEVSMIEELKVNNIDHTLKGTMRFYEANGFKLILNQYEMVKDL